MILRINNICTCSVLLTGKMLSLKGKKFPSLISVYFFNFNNRSMYLIDQLLTFKFYLYIPLLLYS